MSLVEQKLDENIDAYFDTVGTSEVNSQMWRKKESLTSINEMKEEQGEISDSGEN